MVVVVSPPPQPARTTTPSMTTSSTETNTSDLENLSTDGPPWEVDVLFSLYPRDRPSDIGLSGATSTREYVHLVQFMAHLWSSPVSYTHLEPTSRTPIS